MLIQDQTFSQFCSNNGINHIELGAAGTLKAFSEKNIKNIPYTMGDVAASFPNAKTGKTLSPSSLHIPKEKYGISFKAAKMNGHSHNANATAENNNPAKDNSSACFLENGFKKHFLSLRIVNPAIPELIIENGIDGFKPNPDFVNWYNGLNETQQSAIQGSLIDSVFDANMALLGVKTQRRIAAEKAEMERNETAIKNAVSLLTASGYVVFKATDLQSAIEYRAMQTLFPDNGSIMEWQAQSCPVIDNREILPAYDGNGFQYDSFGCLDNQVCMVNWKAVLPSKARSRLQGNDYLLFLPERGNLSKTEMDILVKQTKDKVSKRSINLGADIHKAWTEYHHAYQSKVDAERLAQAEAEAKAKQAQEALKLLMDNPELMAQLLSQATATA